MQVSKRIERNRKVQVRTNVLSCTYTFQIDYVIILVTFIRKMASVFVYARLLRTLFYGLFLVYRNTFIGSPRR